MGNTEKKPLEYSYDVPRDLLTVEGIMYTGALFRGLGMGEIGSVLRIEGRAGTLVTVRKITKEVAALKRLLKESVEALERIEEDDSIAACQCTHKVECVHCEALALLARIKEAGW